MEKATLPLSAGLGRERGRVGKGTLDVAERIGKDKETAISTMFTEN